MCGKHSIEYGDRWWIYQGGGPVQDNWVTGDILRRNLIALVRLVSSHTEGYLKEPGWPPLCSGFLCSLVTLSTPGALAAICHLQQSQHSVLQLPDHEVTALLSSQLQYFEIATQHGLNPCLLAQWWSVILNPRLLTSWGSKNHPKTLIFIESMMAAKLELRGINKNHFMAGG